MRTSSQVTLASPLVLVAAVIVGCSSTKPQPAELVPLTNVVAKLFDAEHRSDSGAVRRLVADDTGFTTANDVQRRRPELVSDGLQSLTPQTPYLLFRDSAYVEYRVGTRRSPLDLLAFRFVRRDSGWLVASVGRAGVY
jgi:hypothetical protein